MPFLLARSKTRMPTPQQTLNTHTTQQSLTTLKKLREKQQLRIRKLLLFFIFFSSGLYIWSSCKYCHNVVKRNAILCAHMYISLSKQTCFKNTILKKRAGEGLKNNWRVETLELEDWQRMCLLDLPQHRPTSLGLGSAEDPGFIVLCILHENHRFSQPHRAQGVV